MRKSIENRDTTLKLTAKIQELQNEVNGMNDSRDFQGAESVRSGLSHVTSQPVLLPPFRDRGMYLFTISYGSGNGSKKWSWLIQWMN